MNEFRDAIAQACREGFAGHHFTAQADAVLAMPEMQAVRQALRWEFISGYFADDTPRHGGASSLEVMLLRGYPYSFAAWVLDGAG